MAQTSAQALVRSIKNHSKKIISDPKHANLILKILELTQNDEDEVVSASCNATGKVFCHFISSGHLIETGKTTVAEEDLSKEDQFSAWLREQFTTACDILYDLLSSTTGSVAETAMASLISLLKAEEKQGCHGFKVKLTEGILNGLLSDSVNQSHLVALLPAILEDEREEEEEEEEGESSSPEICSIALKHLKKALKSVPQPACDHFLSNMWQVIKKIAAQDLDDACKRLMTRVVTDFLKLKMPTRLYREILVGISNIMEKMSSPVVLTDFLSESFNIGGAISLMSLQGLFILMTRYNLEYPAFYTKLYSMFEPQVFSTRYRARFFHLADTFLMSSHLPSYLVAAFAKRLARLSLHAPTSALYVTVPFVLNLLARHPACQVLLHRTEGQLEFDEDPFLPNEKDPKNCKALESCLWELQTLENHVDPNIAEKAKKRRVVETDMSELLDTATEDIIEKAAKKIKQDIPVTFEPLTSLKMPAGFVL